MDNNEKPMMMESLYIFDPFSERVIHGIRAEWVSELDLPDGVVEIKDNALYNCKEATILRLPKSLKKIGYDAYRTYSIEELYYDGTIEDLFQIEIAEFMNFISNDTKLYMLDSNGDKFYNNKAYKLVTDIIIPKSIKKPINSVFQYYKHLKNIFFLGSMDDYFKIGFTQEMDIMRYDRTLYFLDDNGEYEYMDKLFNKLTEIIIPNNIDTITNRYSSLGRLKSITIPESIKVFNDQALSGTYFNELYYDGKIEDWCNMEFECDHIINIIMREDTIFYLLDDLGTIIHNNKKYTKITNLVIPKTVKIIKNFTFQYFCQLESVILPKEVEQIGLFTFSRCSNLKTINLDNVLRIDQGAFKECISLEKIVLPDEMDYISFNAFEDCESLRSINLPSKMNEAGKSIFCGCKSLDEVIIKDECPFIMNYELTDLFIKKNMLIKYDNAYYFGPKNNKYQVLIQAINKDIKTCEIHKGCIEINDNAFEECHELVKVNVYDGLEKIGCRAFENCEALEEIKLPNSVKEIGKDAFIYSGLKSFVFPEKIEEIEDDVLRFSKKLEAVTMGSNVKKIGENAFGCCTNLRSIKLSKAIKEIGESAFNLCTSLEKIDLPKNLCKISRSVFNMCGSIKEIIMPDSLDVIEEETFFGCDSLESIVIPKGVKKIEEGAFKLCRSLKEIIIPESVTEIEKEVFQCCASLESIKLPNSIEIIQDSLFDNCKKLENIKIPNSVKRIEKSAFEDCISLEDVVMSSNIEYIHETSFYNCKNIMYYKFENGVYLLDDKNECIALMSVVSQDIEECFVKDGCRIIGPYAFYNCSNMKMFGMYPSVKAIMKNAFKDCISLEKFFYHGYKESFKDVIMIDEYSNPLYYTKAIMAFAEEEGN